MYRHHGFQPMTCESDGHVWQWDGEDEETTTEKCSICGAIRALDKFHTYPVKP